MLASGERYNDEESLGGNGGRNGRWEREYGMEGRCIPCKILCVMANVLCTRYAATRLVRNRYLDSGGVSANDEVHSLRF